MKCPLCGGEFKDAGRRRGGLISRREFDSGDSDKLHKAKAAKKLRRERAEVRATKRGDS